MCSFIGGDRANRTFSIVKILFLTHFVANSANPELNGPIVNPENVVSAFKERKNRDIIRA